jgi:hypothetical protein
MRLLPLLLLLVGCAGVDVKRITTEHSNPAPSSSLTRAEAIAMGEAWFTSDKLNRRYIEVRPTSSMVPLYDSRTILLVERVNGPVLKGQSLLFDRPDVPGDLVCHGAQKVEADRVYISGLNVLHPDGWVPLSAVFWRVSVALYTDSARSDRNPPANPKLGE